ncbi:hypothetical protein [Mycobacterium syngnathidarum]|uniref:Uncharacterized protein n=1 Tax=Mycobacterium syngnathidarum TaxID=1908205 RepID=A0A1Q9WF30_9MYCO|nr:hypothetical protein [Mycobacterium syngnathidarum]OHT93183.1 hypothetical protein BKG61_22475 [Mycobacterium syngnathidarum]OLT97401.1 hypothetical protein BKG60_07265 [Mycobacterium syngnathidarum]
MTEPADPTASDKVRAVDCRRAGALVTHCLTRDSLGTRTVLAEATADGRLLETFRATLVLVFDALAPDLRDHPEKLDILRAWTANAADNENKENN